jgi:predicted acylesterase/phospholipase RssA
MFTKLVLSGGSIKGFSSLGVVQYFLDNKLLDIDTYVGCSCGAMAGYLLAIGYTPIEIITYLCINNATENIVSDFDINKMLEGKGLTEFKLQQLFEKMTIDKIGRFITMAELKKSFNKTFICSVYNLTKKETEYFGPDTTPTMPCITAVMISCNLPFILEKYKYMNCYYIDGGISDNFPIQLVDNGEDSVLGINIDNTPKEDTELDKDFNIAEEFFELLFVPVRQISLNKIKDTSDKCYIFTVTVNASKLKFNPTKTDMMDFFSTGYQQIKNVYDKEGKEGHAKEGDDNG